MFVPAKLKLRVGLREQVLVLATSAGRGCLEDAESSKITV